jgi:hypothetical protein
MEAESAGCRGLLDMEIRRHRTAYRVVIIVTGLSSDLTGFLMLMVWLDIQISLDLASAFPGVLSYFLQLFPVITGHPWKWLARAGGTSCFGCSQRDVLFLKAVSDEVVPCYCHLLVSIVTTQMFPLSTLLLLKWSLVFSFVCGELC